MKHTTPHEPPYRRAHQPRPALAVIGATALAMSAAMTLAMSAATALAMSAGPVAAAARQPAEIGAKVFVKSVTAHKFGKILVNQQGLALYYNNADSSSRWACTGACLILWPPLTLPKGETLAQLANGTSGLGTVIGLTGRQVTWDGKALYTFSKDTPGAVKGQGIGRIWYVVQLSRARAGTGRTTTTGGGY